MILSLSFSASETLSGSAPVTETESSHLHTQAGVCLPGRSYYHLNSLRAGILLCRHVRRISCHGLSYSAPLGVSKCEHRTSVLIFAFMGTGFESEPEEAVRKLVATPSVECLLCARHCICPVPSCSYSV